MPPPRAEVEDGFAGLEFGEGGGVAAAEGGEDGGFGQLALLELIVEAGGDGVGWLRATGGDGGAAAAGGGLAGDDAQGGLAVVLLDGVFEVFVGGLLGHG